MSEPTFTLGADGKSITCLKCGRTSHNINDVTFRYCGNCNLWHDGPNLLNVENEMALLEFTQFIGKVFAECLPGVHFFSDSLSTPGRWAGRA